MDLFNPNRFPNRKPSASDRYLGVSSHAPPLFENPTASTDELNEDDVVFYSEYSNAEPSHHHFSTPSSSTSTSASATPTHHHHHCGILAALPESSSANIRSVSPFFRKASISSISSSSSSSSSSRLIPAIPRPPPPAHSSSFKMHQSAPVNVPIMSEEAMKARRRHREFDEDDDDGEDEDEDEEEMVPPHEIVARNSARSPMLAYSVLEGVGRTLKGRDLRQVRNAVWRQTGFLD
ncbi:hypothetical protein RJT34_31007 [Clitoria ternatea]|uniref:Senescence regulator n=1 Tax=Clitoria ternatea TaxID=43366 RepID=A0AAN9F1B8_CLITE